MKLLLLLLLLLLGLARETTKHSGERESNQFGLGY